MKTASPPEVYAEVGNMLPALAMPEAGLTTQATKNMLYVQPSSKTGWLTCLNDNPRRSEDGPLSIHDIPDGRIQHLNEPDSTSTD